ncbi:Alkaline phosphatase synthesis sensor protein PhoR [compost metagenome]
MILKFLMTLLDASPDFVCFKDGEGHWLLANDAFVKLFQLDTIAYEGKTNLDLAQLRPFFHDAFHICDETDVRAWDSGTRCRAEEIIPQPEAPPVILETIKVPVFNDDGSRIGLVVIGRDITERKQSEQALQQLTEALQRRKEQVEAEVAERTRELQRANEKLRELDRLKSDFINSASHELRTPLTSIKGYAEFLEDGIGGELTPQQDLFVTQIQQSADRLQFLVEDLLDFARLEAGTFRLSPQEADLSRVVEKGLSSLLPQASDSKLTLEAEVPADPMILRMDPKRIEQVLFNLVGNAIKFTPAGGRIRVSVAPKDSEFELAIQDSGVGISPEHLPRLFEKFFQVDPTNTREHSGAGLGLAISKSLIEAHGGRIGVESQPGEGSTFWFTLPRLSQKGD